MDDQSDPAPWHCFCPKRQRNERRRCTHVQVCGWSSSMAAPRPGPAGGVQSHRKGSGRQPCMSPRAARRCIGKSRFISHPLIAKVTLALFFHITKCMQKMLKLLALFPHHNKTCAKDDWKPQKRSSSLPWFFCSTDICQTFLFVHVWIMFAVAICFVGNRIVWRRPGWKLSEGTI